MLSGLAILISSCALHDSVPPTDTAFISVHRSDFASVGRLQRIWNQSSGNKSLTQQLAADGVFFKQYGVSGIATISRRGADPQQTQVLWNGLPVANPMLGMTDLNTFFLFGNSEIRLIEGGNASMYGSGSVGGTLQINQSRPENHGLFVGNSITTGSFGLLQNGLDMGYGSAKFYLRSTTFYSETANNFKYSDLNQNNEWVNVKMRQSNTRFLTQRFSGGFQLKNWEFRAIAEYNQSNRNLGFLPGSPNFQGAQQDKSWRGMAESVFKKKRIQWINRIGITRDFIRFYVPAKNENDSSLASTKHLQTELYFVQKNWKFLTGADLQVQQGLASAYAGTKSGVYPGQFLSAWFHKNRWDFTASARFEWKEKIPVYSLSTERTINASLKFKANAQSTFRRPTLNDLFWEKQGNPTLKSEKGIGAEVGLGYLKSNKIMGIKLDFCLYYRELYHPIIWQPVGANWEAVNLNFARYYGSQLNMTFSQKTVLGSFAEIVNWDYVQTAMQSAPNEVYKQRIFVPGNNGNLMLKWNKKLVSIWVNANYTGTRFTSTDNEVYLPAYFLLGAGAQYFFGTYKKWEAGIALQGDNLTGTEYQNMPGRPMPLQSFRITLTIKSKQ